METPPDKHAALICAARAVLEVYAASKLQQQQQPSKHNTTTPPASPPPHSSRRRGSASPPKLHPSAAAAKPWLPSGCAGSQHLPRTSPRKAAVSPQRQSRAIADSCSSKGGTTTTAYHAALQVAYRPPAVRQTTLDLRAALVDNKAPRVRGQHHHHHAVDSSSSTGSPAATAAAAAAAAGLNSTRSRGAEPTQPSGAAAAAAQQEETLRGFTSGYIDGRLAALLGGGSSGGSPALAGSLAGQLAASNSGREATAGCAEELQRQIRPQLVKEIAMKIMSAALAPLNKASTPPAAAAAAAATLPAAAATPAQSLLAADPQQLQRWLLQMQRQQSTDLVPRLPSPPRRLHHRRQQAQQQQQQQQQQESLCLPEFSVSAFDHEDHCYLIPVAHIGCQTSEVFSGRPLSPSCEAPHHQQPAASVRNTAVPAQDGCSATATTTAGQASSSSNSGMPQQAALPDMPPGSGSVAEQHRSQQQTEGAAQPQSGVPPGQEQQRKEAVALLPLLHQPQQQHYSLEAGPSAGLQQSDAAAAAAGAAADTRDDARPASPDKARSSLVRIEELVQHLTQQQQQQQPHDKAAGRLQRFSVVQEGGQHHEAPQGLKSHHSLSKPPSETESGSLLGLQVLERLLCQLEVLQQPTSPRWQHSQVAAAGAAVDQQLDQLELSRLDALIAQVALLDHLLTERCGTCHPAAAQLGRLQQDLQAWRSRVGSGCTTLSSPPACVSSSTKQQARPAVAVSPTAASRGACPLSPRALSLQQQQWLAALPGSPAPACPVPATSSSAAQRQPVPPEQQLLSPILSGGLLRSRSLLGLQPVEEGREGESEAASSLVKKQHQKHSSSFSGFLSRPSGWLSPRSRGSTASHPAPAAAGGATSSADTPPSSQHGCAEPHSTSRSSGGIGSGGSRAVGGITLAAESHSSPSSADRKRGFMLALKQTLQHNMQQLGGLKPSKASGRLTDEALQRVARH